ncbi:KGGVGR-motif variant AAA ATPase [Glycomyces sp. YM15]|uniref:KGGVGR-motif variant AAA ATPase n=1 Tax=Glycomyces sp. YM15 TaxID=2800446 RepID=UPI0023DD0502|nr:P-loop NTPase [Glycomyces sp. YM15]
MSTPATYTARCVLHSASGGTGRTTAAVMLARHLAGQGHHVLLVDLDVRSPGAAIMLGSGASLPRHGVVDALAAPDETAFALDLVALSSYAPEGAPGGVWVAPAWGIAGPRLAADDPDEGALTAQLANALNACAAAVESASGRYPDVILMDVPAGIDPIADAALTDLSDFAFLFAPDTGGTWEVYRHLFTTWLRSGQAPVIREQLRVVAAMSRDLRGTAHAVVAEQSWDAFSILYDDAPAPVTGQLAPDVFHPPLQDEAAPHYPLPVLFVPSMYNIDSTSADVAGWHDRIFIQAAFRDFLQVAAPLVTAAIEPVAAR